MNFRGRTQRDIQFVLCSKCETPVSAPACAELSSQVRSSLQANTQPATITQHQRIRCYSPKLLTFRELDKHQTSKYLGDRYFRWIRRLMLTLIGAELIRIPLSRLQLVPLFVLSEDVVQFRQIGFPTLKLYRVRNRWLMVEPSVCVARREFKCANAK